MPENLFMASTYTKGQGKVTVVFFRFYGLLGEKILVSMNCLEKKNSGFHD
jgi:hypothetical protein